MKSCDVGPMVLNEKMAPYKRMYGVKWDCYDDCADCTVRWRDECNRWVDKRNRANEMLERTYTPKQLNEIEKEISSVGWLQHVNWAGYYKVVRARLTRYGNEQDYHHVLDAAGREIPVPWKTEYFEDIEKRRIIGGMGEPYSWLGSVAASGQFRSLLANGTPKQWAIIAESINALAGLNPPIPWSQLRLHLDALISLGPTMKVWSRLHCIVRPDLYCSVAGDSVRRILSQMLHIQESRLSESEGYIQVIKLLHSSPWFKSNKPHDGTQAAIWNRRVAFLDAVLYSDDC
jgi:hypothetical protein